MYIEVHAIDGPNGGVNGMHVTEGTALLVASALEVGLEGAPALERDEAYAVLELLKGGAGR